MMPRTQHLFLFIGLVNGWIIPTSMALAISWATTVLVFFSMIKQDSFYTRMESKLFIILCNVHFLETRGLFLKSPMTFRAYLGCHNSLYIFATPRFSTIKLCNPFDFFFLTLKASKDPLFETSGLQFDNWLFRPEKFSGHSRNGWRVCQIIIVKEIKGGLLNRSVVVY